MSRSWRSFAGFGACGEIRTRGGSLASSGLLFLCCVRIAHRVLAVAPVAREFAKGGGQQNKSREDIMVQAGEAQLHTSSSEVEETAVARKVYRRLSWFLVLLFICSYLDRIN